MNLSCSIAVLGSQTNRSIQLIESSLNTASLGVNNYVKCYSSIKTFVRQIGVRFDQPLYLYCCLGTPTALCFPVYQSIVDFYRKRPKNINRVSIPISYINSFFAAPWTAEGYWKFFNFFRYFIASGKGHVAKAWTENHVISSVKFRKRLLGNSYSGQRSLNVAFEHREFCMAFSQIVHAPLLRLSDHLTQLTTRGCKRNQSGRKSDHGGKQRLISVKPKFKARCGRRLGYGLSGNSKAAEPNVRRCPSPRDQQREHCDHEERRARIHEWIDGSCAVATSRVVCFPSTVAA